jgi:hypothetical protein
MFDSLNSFKTSDRHIRVSQGINALDRHIRVSQGINASDRHIRVSQGINALDRHIRVSQGINASDRQIRVSQGINALDRHIRVSQGINVLELGQIIILSRAMWSVQRSPYCSGQRHHSKLSLCAAVLSNSYSLVEYSQLDMSPL